MEASWWTRTDSGGLLRTWSRTARCPISTERIEQSGAMKARAAFAHIPVARVEQLPDADAIIFGTPTRFGNMCSQMRNFLDQCG
jgi:NADPH-dependent FMN reductase